jgi:hypothetical protein
MECVTSAPGNLLPQIVKLRATACQEIAAGRTFEFPAQPSVPLHHRDFGFAVRQYPASSKY